MNLKIKSKIKSDIFRNQAPRVGSFYTRTAALRLWAHRRVFLCHLFGLSSSSTHCCSCSTPAFTHLNNCQLCVTLNFQLHSFGSSCLTGNGGSADQTTPAHLQPQMHRYPWKHAHVLTAVSYSSPPFCVCSVGPCEGLSLLLAKPHGFPTFHHSSSLVGCRANSTWWRGRAVEHQKLSGLEWRPEISSPFLAAPRTPPHSSLKSLRKQSEKCLSSYTEESVLH